MLEMDHGCVNRTMSYILLRPRPTETNMPICLLHARTVDKHALDFNFARQAGSTSSEGWVFPGRRR